MSLKSLKLPNALKISKMIKISSNHQNGKNTPKMFKLTKCHWKKITKYHPPPPPPPKKKKTTKITKISLKCPNNKNTLRTPKIIKILLKSFCPFWRSNGSLVNLKILGVFLVILEVWVILIFLTIQDYFNYVGGSKDILIFIVLSRLFWSVGGFWRFSYKRMKKISFILCQTLE